MGTRGRKSLADLAVLAAAKPRPAFIRSGLTPEVKQILHELLSQVPAEHFRPSDGALVEQYAQSIALARQAYSFIAAEGPVVGGRPSPWLVVLEKAHRSSVALSMRLRLAPQSRLDAKATTRSGPPPSYYESHFSDDR